MEKTPSVKKTIAEQRYALRRRKNLHSQSGMLNLMGWWGNCVVGCVLGGNSWGRWVWVVVCVCASRKVGVFGVRCGVVGPLYCSNL